MGLTERYLFEDEDTAVNGMIDEQYKMNELSPCPFCGEIPEMHFLKYNILNLPIYWVECPSCSAQIKGQMTEQSAIEAWNTRIRFEEN